MMNKNIPFYFIRTIAFLSIMGLLWILPQAAQAQSTVFSRALDTLYTTFGNARTIVYATAGFGLIGVAVAAISGKLPWRWLAMISVALFTLAAAEKIVLYVSNAGNNTSVESDFAGDVKSSEFYVGDNSSSFDYNSFNQNSTDQSFKDFLQNGN